MFYANKVFAFLFGYWSKASTCKNLVKDLKSRLQTLKRKMESVVKNERNSIGQLLKNGQCPASTFSRVERLFKDENLLAVYDLLDDFAEFIILHLPYISRCKDCPRDINEAISTLVFASARCANLPELQELRKLFCKRYGDCFEVAAVEDTPWNVNQQIIEKLTAVVTDEVKLNLVHEIAQKYDTNHHLNTNVYEKDVGIAYRSNDVKIKKPEILEHMHSRVTASSIPQYDTDTEVLNKKQPSAEQEGSHGSSDMDTSSSTDEDTATKIIIRVSKHLTNFDKKKQNAPPLTNRIRPQRRRHRGERSAAGQATTTDRITGDDVCGQYYEGILDHSDIDANSSCAKREPRNLPTRNESAVTNRRKKTSPSSRPENKRTDYTNKKSSFNQYCSEHPSNFLRSDKEKNSCKVYEHKDAKNTSGELKAENNRGRDQNHVKPQNMRPPYTRVQSIPVKNLKMGGMKKALRGCGSASSNHTHPNLPDYDDFTATFTALKEKYAVNTGSAHRTERREIWAC